MQEIDRTADWIIDLGPEAWPGLDPGASDGGGEIVAAGPPEEIVREKRSYTGGVLEAVLARRGVGGKKKRTEAAERAEMAHKFFYAWQSERPNAVCRQFIRQALDSVATELQQAGIDERVEIDSDTQNVPGIPEIVGTIFRKIEEDDVFVADLTMCSETLDTNEPRRSPNANVMFEYGFALKAKGRDRIICVMNDFYGGRDPSELPFDLRHARAPIRYTLSPNSSPEERKIAKAKLRQALLPAAKLIIDNIPSPKTDVPHIQFDKPLFGKADQLTPEGDFEGQTDPTFFAGRDSFIYLRGRPLILKTLTIAEIRKAEIPGAGLNVSTGSLAGSDGTNKWGRISYAIDNDKSKRLSRDYAQFLRTGEIEMINSSYFTNLLHNEQKIVYPAGLVNHIISPMLRNARQWMEKIDEKSFVIEIGIVGIEGWRLTLNNRRAGPMIHINKVAVQKMVQKDSIESLQDEFLSTLLGEAGYSI